MNIKFWLNGIQRQEEVDPGMLLIDFLREKGCYSVKRGCESDAEFQALETALDKIPVHGHRGFSEQQGNSMANWGKK